MEVVYMPGGSGTGIITEQLKQIKDIKWPSPVVHVDHRTYFGNMLCQFIDTHKKGKGYKYHIPIEYGFVFTKSYPNKNYIYLDRYPILPYWNRNYSHPMIEKLSNFEFTHPTSVHKLYDKDDMYMHGVFEKSANSATGYYLANDDITRTY